jgi:ferredoxin--NADP+ reductase/benzoate/toluate 1,2-dioxygenase reductase subunit
MTNQASDKSTKSITVQSIRHLSGSAYVLRFDRNQRKFSAGQHVILGIKNENNAREYSVYSGEKDNYFEVLIKEVLEGDVSKRLKKLKPGSELQMDGPMGFFTIEPQDITTKKFIFIATGTGIAPFRSCVRSYPEIDYKILHGVRHGDEAYDRTEYDANRYTLCTTGDQSGNYNGRVTEYLTENPIDTEAHYYLCGNVKMIHEAFDLLSSKGVPDDNLHAEVYF